MSQSELLLHAIQNQKEMRNMKTDELLRRISHQLSQIIYLLDTEKLNKKQENLINIYNQ